MKLSLLIVDDDEVMRDTLSDVLKKKGYEVSVASSGNEALSAIRKNIVDLIVLDMRLPDLDGIEVLKRVKEFDTEILVIMMTAYSDVQTAVSAMKSGAYHYINKPFELEELTLLIEKGLETKSLINEVRRLRRQQKGDYQDIHIHGTSPQIQSVKELIAMISKTQKTSVLIQGESGTGKELVANAVHYSSKRSQQTAHEDQLQCHSGFSPGVRTLWVRKRGFYRCEGDEEGALRAGRRRDGLLG